MSKEEPLVTEKITVSIPSAIQKFTDGKNSIKAEIYNVIEINEQWQILYFRVDENEFMLEEYLADDEWCYFLGVEWDALDNEGIFLDVEDKYRKKIKARGEEFEHFVDEEGIEYYGHASDEEGMFEYVDYKHIHNDYYVRITYWDDEEDYDVYIFTEIDATDFDIE